MHTLNNIRAAGFAAFALCLAAPVSAEVVSTGDDSFVTRDAATVSANGKATWLALISPGEWWNDEHSWSGDASNMTLIPQGGGCFCERIPGSDADDAFALDGSAQHMQVVQSIPMQVLRMRGGLGPLQGEPATGVLTVTLTDIDGGTRIVWEYNVGGSMRYPVDAISKAVDAVMSQQLGSLADMLGRLAAKDTPASPATPDPAPASEADADPDIGAAIDAMGADDE